MTWGPKTPSAVTDAINEESVVDRVTQLPAIVLVCDLGSPGVGTNSVSESAPIWPGGRIGKQPMSAISGDMLFCRSGFTPREHIRLYKSVPRTTNCTMGRPIRALRPRPCHAPRHRRSIRLGVYISSREAHDSLNPNLYKVPLSPSHNPPACGSCILSTGVVCFQYLRPRVPNLPAHWSPMTSGPMQPTVI